MSDGMSHEEMKRLESLVDKAKDELGEHFESVRIFVTTTENGHTQSFTKGSGNYHAQIGQIQEFLICDRVQTEEDQRSRIQRDSN